MNFQVLLVIPLIFLIRYLQGIYWNYKFNCKPIKHRRIVNPFNSVTVSKSGRALDIEHEGFKDTKTLQVYILFKSFVVTCDRDNIKHLMNTHHSIGLRKQLSKSLLGHGVFSSDGKQWKHSRELLRPLFKMPQLSHLDVHFHDFLKYINQPVELQSLFQKLAFDINSEFLFGQSVNSLNDPSQDYLDFEKASEKLAKYNPLKTILVTVLGEYHSLFEPKYVGDAIKTVHKFIQNYIHENNGGLINDLVNQKLSPKEIQDQVLSVMVAGKNTTSSLLTYLFLELSQNPDLYNELREEVLKLDEITIANLNTCKVLNNYINESLRLHPPIPRNLRKTVSPVILPHGNDENPSYLPKGTTVIFNIYSLHRSSEFGPDPESFSPKRWNTIKPKSFMPFGYGPRMCLGKELSLVESRYIIVKLVTMFKGLKKISGGELTNSGPSLKLLDGLTVEFF
ncbi:cytochrome P450 52A13 [[Candida] jaroonii]|uniref:Cytochrome P450 52A13 n=1 Tax=[Candida] jaroonii TaxID=467808 RepID=A0ACA9YAP3_9ASCO|nr:cytochrome P450 52A13 [[Candida] jaroonii]